MHSTLKKSLALLAFGAALAAVAAPASAAADLGGTWIIQSPQHVLTTTDGKTPPLTAAARKVYEAHMAASAKSDRSWDPVAKCKPPGEPRTFVTKGWPFELMQSSDRVDFLFQWNRLDRTVPMLDKQPPFEAPYYFGQSIGHWDGDTLVVNVIGIKSNTTLDDAGLPHSDNLALTERYRLTDGGRTLEARIHVVDPTDYTQPWDTVLTFRRAPAGTRIAEDVCFEREKLNIYATLQNSVTNALPAPAAK